MCFQWQRNLRLESTGGGTSIPNGSRIDMKPSAMKTLTAKDAKYGFGQLIDLARSEPVAVSKHGRPVVVVVAVEEFKRLMALEHRSKSPLPRTEKKERKK